MPVEKLENDLTGSSQGSNKEDNKQETAAAPPTAAPAATTKSSTSKLNILKKNTAKNAGKMKKGTPFCDRNLEW